MDKKRLLLVEDEALTAMNLKSNLIDLGYEVPAMVSTGEEAIRATAELLPDLIIMDITLDGSMSGIEAADVIHKSYACPIVFLTAHSDSETIRMAKTAEPFGYLPKPYNISTLKSTIEIALYKSEADARIRESEKRLQIAEGKTEKMKAVGILSEGVAHHFNNILQSIIGFGILAQQRVDEDETTRKYIEVILLNAKRAAEITQGLLAFSRRQIVQLKRGDLNAIISKNQKTLSMSAGESIELKILLSPEKLAVMVDTEQIEQVLLNLVNNACDAMTSGGVLTVSTKQVEITDEYAEGYQFEDKGGYAVLVVSDTGVGIDRKTIEHIFEPFFTTKEVGKGTGLGLAMVYGIAKAHGGNVIVHSEPGKGTTCRIYLPLEKAEDKYVYRA